MHSIFVLADSTGKPSERGSIRGERSGRGGKERRTPLDSASRSIFSNGDLLSDIQSEDPFSIGGIYGTSRGLKVSKNGDFGGLGCVGLSKPAAVSVLSKTQTSSIAVNKYPLIKQTMFITLLPGCLPTHLEE